MRHQKTFMTVLLASVLFIGTSVAQDIGSLAAQQSETQFSGSATAPSTQTDQFAQDQFAHEEEDLLVQQNQQQLLADEEEATQTGMQPAQPNQQFAEATEPSQQIVEDVTIIIIE